MPSIPARSWALAALSAALQLMIFPISGALPQWRAALGWVALVPLLVVLIGGEKPFGARAIRAAAVLGYACGICWYMGNCYWIFQTMHIYGGLPNIVALVILLLFSLYLGLYHALFAATLAVLRSSFLGVRGTLLLSPFVWVAVEMARSRITCFPWDLLGYSQVDNAFVTALAPVAGVMSISFVLVSLNACIAWMWVAPAKKNIAISLGGVALAVALQVSGLMRTYPSATRVAERVPYAVMMQENIEVGAVGKAAPPLSLSEEISEFTRWSLRPEVNFSRSGASSAWDIDQAPGHPEVLVWPEAPSHLISNDPYFLSAIGQLTRAADAPAIVGSLGIDRSELSARGYYLYDSASLFDLDGTLTGRYDKIHLVPWGEYVPFKQLFSFAEKLTEGVGNMDRGTRRDVFALRGHRYGVFVCYESIFGDEVREFVKDGAEVLVNISDDGWYGDSGAPWQHLNMARMRAIENHRWVLRSTNTGITTAIDPWGRTALQAPRHVRAAFAFPFGFEPASEQTFYTRHGDWFGWMCVLISLGALAWGWMVRREDATRRQ